ncbi:MAG: ribonuclease G [Betaproteobacteria bacterium]|jgi:ribonuclease G|nr:MAG: ribonuclease G [Betaproteobacteria bacterium]
MSEEILINITPQETRVAVVHLGAVQELHIERSGGRGIAGNCYLGKVMRVLPGMQSAFLDIGLERTAFLHVGDILEARCEECPRPIEQILHEGQSILVQVIKDPIGTKGARLSTQISLAGRCLVFLPQETKIGVSQKIGNVSERDSLRARLDALIPPDTGRGFIIRTQAADANDYELSADIEYLHTLWDAINHRAATSEGPTLIFQELDLAHRALRDIAGEATTQILVDSRETFQRMRAFSEDFTAPLHDRLSHYSADRPLFELYGIEEEIEKALSRRVDLKSGGYLIIDQTEALTTIDVNTGAFVGAKNFDETIFKTNLEAAQAAARQMRLRNLGGIIIIDFIDMDNAMHREAVLTELGRMLGRDRTRTTMSGFSTLGLVEITRKRTRESLSRQLCETCPTCQGRGQIKTAQTVCYEILRAVLRESRQFDTREFRILAEQHVIDLFLDEEAQSLAQLSDFIGKRVALQVETVFTQEQYDIILL